MNLMTNLQIHKRETSLDLLRIFAVIAVVFTHVGKSDYSSAIEEVVFSVITRWAVPCFVMISGRLFLDPEREYSAKKLKNSILHILIAAVFWNIVYQLLFYWSGYYEGLNFKGIVYSGALAGPYHFWYIWMIIALYAITPLLRMLCTKKKLMKYFIVLFFVAEFLVLYSVHLPAIGDTFSKLLTDAHFHFALGFSGFFILGYYLYRYRFDKRRRIIIYSLGAIMLVATCIAALFIQRIGSDLTVNDYLSPNIALISVAVFVFFLNSNVNQKISDRAKRVITKVSNCTFGIYLIHALFIYLLEKSFLYSNVAPEYIMRPLRTIIIFVLSLVVVMILKRIPWVGIRIS